MINDHYKYTLKCYLNTISDLIKLLEYGIIFLRITLTFN